MTTTKEYTFECDTGAENTKTSKTFSKIVHSDFLDRPAVNTIYYEQPQQYIECPHCGKRAKIRPEIYTSNPPQYKYECEHCGKSGFIFCHEARIIFGEDEKSEYNPWLGFGPKVATKCIICGEETEHYGKVDHPFVCDKCKKAVMKMRKLLEEDD